MSKGKDNHDSAGKHFLRSYLFLRMSVSSITQLVQMLEQEHTFYSDLQEKYALQPMHNDATRKLLKRLRLLIKEKNVLCEIIIDRIEKMEDETEKTLLTLKYIEGYTWEEVCEKMNYSLRQIYYLHNNALNHFESNY